MPNSELKEVIDQHMRKCTTRTWISHARSFAILVIHLTRRCLFLTDRKNRARGQSRLVQALIRIRGYIHRYMKQLMWTYG